MHTLPRDFLDMIEAFEKNSVRYVVVGAFAMAHSGYFRQTGDIDFFVEPTHENSKRVCAAIRDFGGPTHGVGEAYFATEGNYMQLGLPPLRIDLITSISGMTFDQASSNVSIASLSGYSIPFLGLDSLILNKRAAARPKDLIDAQELERLRAAGQQKP